MTRLAQLNLYNTLSDKTLNKVFMEIVKSRIVTKFYLSEQLGVADDQIVDSLKQLKGLGVIDNKPAVISDWDKYFITKEGLAAVRELE